VGPSVAKASRLTRTQTNRLRACRVAAGMSQRALAREAAVSRMTVQRIERGEVLPTATTLKALSEALRVHPVELVSEPQESEAWRRAGA
jgi:transcriptional regulator with XRE-family HTH domain